MSERLLVIGPGRAGLSLGYALWRAGGLDSLTFCGRRPDPPPHPLFIDGIAEYVFGLRQPEPGSTAVLLAVPDEILPEITLALASQGDAPPGCAAFHLSGALGTDPLAPLLERGYSVGTLHPLQSLADPLLGPEQLEGIYFAVSGEPAALSAARRILSPIGGSVLTIPVARRPLYHAAAVFASNYLAGLIGAAGRLMVQAGVPEDEAIQAILPLARGSLENLGRLGPVRALTGPISRGDVETVRLHLRTLEARERALYASMGLEILALAGEAGLDQDAKDELKELFEREK
ncbi:MAG: DUF2520 domain-containing protein [Gemmatimonadetes bacterium]|nr:DUF2520 domain-containing protein [Gemmatimonadota bacterium]NNM05922.1 DUF2520 domain-containing protein [Gemmatimonadota bacterium]